MSTVVGEEEARKLLHKHRDDPYGGNTAWIESDANRYKKDDKGNFITNSSNRRIKYTVFEGEYSEESRNAEHYLYAYHRVKENPSIFSVVEYSILSSGYTPIKAIPNGADKFLRMATYSYEIEKDIMGQLGSMHYESIEPKYGPVPPHAPRSPYRFTPATIDEIKSGFLGAKAGYDDYYKEQKEVEKAVVALIKESIPTLREARLNTAMEDIDSLKAMIANEANIPFDRIDIELMKYTGYIPLGDDITPSSIQDHLSEKGIFKDLSLSFMSKFYDKELDYAVEHGNILAEAIKSLGIEEAAKIENIKEWKETQSLENPTQGRIFPKLVDDDLLNELLHTDYQSNPERFTAICEEISLRPENQTLLQEGIAQVAREQELAQKIQCESQNIENNKPLKMSF